MSDQPPHNEPTPNNPSEGSSADLSADDLDSLLAQAADLAQDLSNEMGSSQPTPQLNDSDAQFLQGDSSPDADLDAQIGEIERLVDEAARELSEPAPQATSKPSEAPTESQGDPKSRIQKAVGRTSAGSDPKGDVQQEDDWEDLTPSDDVPDFMNNPDVPITAAKNPPQPVSSEPAAKNRHENNASEPAAKNPPHPVSSEAAGQNPHQDAAEARSPDNDAAPADGSDGWLRRALALLSFFQNALEMVTKMSHGVTMAPWAWIKRAYPLLAIVVSLLELVDKPFSRIGTRLRVYIGWAAIATLGTAFATFVAALVK